MLIGERGRNAFEWRFAVTKVDVIGAKLGQCNGFENEHNVLSHHSDQCFQVDCDQFDNSICGFASHVGEFSQYKLPCWIAIVADSHWRLFGAFRDRQQRRECSTAFIHQLYFQ